MNAEPGTSRDRRETFPDGRSGSPLQMLARLPEQVLLRESTKGETTASPDGPSGTAGDKGACITRGEAAAAIRRLTALLRDTGLGPGVLLAVDAPPAVETVLVLLAGIETGAAVLPLHRRERREDHAALLEELGCRHLFCRSSEWRRLPREACVVDPSEIRELALDAVNPREISSPEPVPRCPYDPATVLATSGSSGGPKLVVHGLAAHWASALAVCRHLDFGPGDLWALTLPVYHTGGLAILFRALCTGGGVLLPRGQALLEPAPGDGVTHISLVETQLGRLLARKSACRALAGARAVLVGGGPLAFDRQEAARRAGVPLVHTYGLTEMASTVTATAFPDAGTGARAGEPLAAGRPLPGRELAFSAEGEILLRGSCLMAGYLDRGTRRIADPRDAEGYFHTGDLGSLDDRGNLRVLGRCDNMFICGGENLHPEEIEQALCACPGVLSALVVPLPDEEFGALPGAFVKLAEDCVFDDERLRLSLRDRLASYKLPRRIWNWPAESAGAAARGSTLKPDRTRFAAMAGRLLSAEGGRRT